MSSNVFQRLYDAYKHWPRRARWPLEWMFFVILFVLASGWVSRHMLDTQTPAPVAEFTSLSGTPIRLDWQNEEPHLIYFFAPWCGICRISMPGLNLIPTDDIQIYAVALDFETQAEVEQFVADVGYEGAVLLGDSHIRNKFQIRGYPSYYVIQKGQIQHRDQGLSTPPGLWLRTRGL